ncbi:hypothetical protein [Zhongshania sp. BJYM1]|uniref:hypothetical protein n=1 Tax=Zhongshania aquatica TaxID=2965069 RepID=UPI0022B3C551|nr:hypothetical protein [Marortus sp. BJYM1]
MTSTILKTLPVIGGLILSPIVSACECLWEGPFKSVYPDTDLVVYGEVRSAQGNGFDLVIDTILQGSEYRDEIRIWGKKDDLCRPDANEFPPGSRWVMALKRIENPPEDAFDPFKANISFGRQDDFSLSSCGVYWLPVKQQRVSGNILDGSRWQYLDSKKTPIIMPVFEAWMRSILPDAAIAEAAKPQTRARQLLNETKIHLWEEQRNPLPDAEDLDFRPPSRLDDIAPPAEGDASNETE